MKCNRHLCLSNSLLDIDGFDKNIWVILDLIEKGTKALTITLVDGEISKLISNSEVIATH